MNLSLKRLSVQLTADQVDYLRANSSPGTSMSHLIRNALQKEINITFQQKSFNGSMAIEKLVY